MSDTEDARVALDEHRYRDAEHAARQALSCYGSGSLDDRRLVLG